jgi:hypothetical protein
MKYVYVDESVFSTPRVCVGTGILISNRKLPRQVESSKLEWVLVF